MPAGCPPGRCWSCGRQLGAHVAVAEAGGTLLRRLKVAEVAGASVDPETWGTRDACNQACELLAVLAARCAVADAVALVLDRPKANGGVVVRTDRNNTERVVGLGDPIQHRITGWS